MMKKKQNIWIVLLGIMGLFSCHEGGKEDNLSFDLMVEAVDSLHYSSFVDSVQYIELETTEDCLIGSINDVIRTPTHLFILDRRQQTIWIFDAKGHYLNKIAKQGEGPEEYVNLCQFEYVDNRIVALDLWTRSLLYYDLQGNYQGKKELTVWADDFKLLPDGSIIVSRLGTEQESRGVYLLDVDGNMKQKVIERDPDYVLSMTSDWELCSWEKSVTCMAPILHNEVYHIDNTGAKVVYPFTFYPLPKHAYPEDVSKAKLEDFIRTEYIEGEKWIYATFWSATQDVRCFLYDKAGQRHWIGKFLSNDLDGKEIEGKTSSTLDNTFVFYGENADPDKNPILHVLYLK